MKGANQGSEYRNRFNPEKEYHRDSVVPKERKMKKKEMNYQYNYWYLRSFIYKLIWNK